MLGALCATSKKLDTEVSPEVRYLNEWTVDDGSIAISASFGNLLTAQFGQFTPLGMRNY